MDSTLVCSTVDYVAAYSNRIGYISLIVAYIVLTVREMDIMDEPITGHATRSHSSALLKANSAAPFRFTKDTDEYKLLEKIMRSGQIKPSDRPSDIKDRYEIFAKIGVNAFRSQFNKLKGIVGINTKSGKKAEQRQDS